MLFVHILYPLYIYIYIWIQYWNSLLLEPGWVDRQIPNHPQMIVSDTEANSKHQSSGRLYAIYGRSHGSHAIAEIQAAASNLVYDLKVYSHDMHLACKKLQAADTLLLYIAGGMLGTTSSLNDMGMWSCEHPTNHSSEHLQKRVGPTQKRVPQWLPKNIISSMAHMIPFQISPRYRRGGPYRGAFL